MRARPDGARLQLSVNHHQSSLVTPGRLNDWEDTWSRTGLWSPKRRGAATLWRSVMIGPGLPRHRPHFRGPCHRTGPGYCRRVYSAVAPQRTRNRATMDRSTRIHVKLSIIKASRRSVKLREPFHTEAKITILFISECKQVSSSFTESFQPLQCPIN